MTITASATLIRPPVGDASPTRVHTGPAVLTGGPSDRYRRAHRPVGHRAGLATRTARPNFVLRRCVAALAVTLGALVSVPALGAVMASLGGAPAAAAEASPDQPATQQRHVAVAGDTLWSIAAAHRGDVPHDRYLDALIRLNGGTAIEVGQAVLLP